MILEDDLADRTENLIVLYAEHPSLALFGEPAPAPASHAAPKPALAAATILATTWRAWFRRSPG